MLSSGSAMAGLKDRQALQQSNLHGKYGSGSGRAAQASSEEDADDIENKVRCWFKRVDITRV